MNCMVGGVVVTDARPDHAPYFIPSQTRPAKCHRVDLKIWFSAQRQSILIFVTVGRRFIQTIFSLGKPGSSGTRVDRLLTHQANTVAFA
jgi:hypothetical protein